MQGRIEKNIAMAYNDTTVHSNVPVGRSHACMKICLQNATKGAPLHEQKELRSSGKHRRCVLRMARVNCGSLAEHLYARLAFLQRHRYTENKEGSRRICACRMESFMIRFIITALFVILFLILSIPLLIAEWIIGIQSAVKGSFQPCNCQLGVPHGAAPVRRFRHLHRRGSHSEGYPGSLCR